MSNPTPIKSGLWLITEYAFRYTMTLFVSIAVARHLGPERYGEISYAIAFCSIFVVFTTLGIDELIIKRLINNYDEIHNEVISAFILKFSGGLLAYLIILFLSFFLFDGNILLNIYGIAIVFKSFDIIELWLRSKLRGKIISILKMISLSIVSILKVVAIIRGATNLVFIIIFSLEFIFLAILYLTFYLKPLIVSSARNLRLAGTIILRYCREGFPLMISMFIITLYNKIDIIMLDILTDKHEIGIYSAATKIALLLHAIPLVFCNSIFPKIAEYGSYSPKLKQQLYDINIMLAFSICIPIFLVSGWVIRVGLGESYLDSISILRLYMWGSFFVAMMTVKNNFLILEAKNQYILYSNLIGLSANMILNFFFIQEFGAFGAAISTVVAHSILAVFSNLLFIKVRAYTKYALISLSVPFRVRASLRILKSYY